MEMGECKKIEAVREKSQEIGDFLDWLYSQGINLCKWSEKYHEWLPNHESIEQLLARFYVIDLSKVEEERMKLLEEIRMRK